MSKASSEGSVLGPKQTLDSSIAKLDSSLLRLQGSAKMARQVWQADGIRGFYRGFGTIVFGAIPARGVRLPDPLGSILVCILWNTQHMHG